MQRLILSAAQILRRFHHKVKLLKLRHLHANRLPREIELQSSNIAETDRELVAPLRQMNVIVNKIFNEESNNCSSNVMFCKCWISSMD